MHKAFDLVCGAKLASDGYCDMSEYVLSRITKIKMFGELQNVGSPLAELYKNENSFPNSDTLSIKWNDYSQRFPSSFNPETMKAIEAKALVNWVYRSFKSDLREQFTRALTLVLTER